MGYQFVQCLHAWREFINQNKSLEFEWYENSNYLAVLAVPDEHELIKLLQEASTRGIKCSYFIEPDIGNQITALVLTPTSKSKELCKNLPRAFK